MPTIKTSIIPSKAIFAKTKAPHELHKEAICVFAATGFFLDTDAYFKDELVLPPASHTNVDEHNYYQNSTPWFQWHYSPRAISFDAALAEFTELFEQIIAEQVGDQQVILPLSGGLDSRTQAAALHHLEKEVHAYSYDFWGGFPETAIGKQLAKACDFPFSEYHIDKGYLWDCIEKLATLNQGYSEFTHPRQMAIIDAYKDMGRIFSLGHWGDVLFDGEGEQPNITTDLVEVLLKKIVKKGGMELGTALWKEWDLDGTFISYLRQRVKQLLDTIEIEHSGAKLRAFKSLYWAPRWTAVNLSVFESKRPITLPYFDDRMCQFICTVPEAYLADRRLQIAYLKKRNPTLAKITWEQHKPYNLYTFQKNKSPRNIPYRAFQKLKREVKNIMGRPYVQRNWELQFVGNENDMQLQQYLFKGDLQSLVSEETVRHFYSCFQQKDPVFYSHAVSMLLTLSAKMKQLDHGEKA